LAALRECQISVQDALKATLAKGSAATSGEAATSAAGGVIASSAAYRPELEAAVDKAESVGLVTPPTAAAASASGGGGSEEAADAGDLSSSNPRLYSQDLSAAMASLEVFLAEDKALAALQKAIATRNRQQLASAVEGCNGLFSPATPTPTPEVLAMAKELLVQVEAEALVLRELRSAVLMAKAGGFTEARPTLETAIKNAKQAAGVPDAANAAGGNVGGGAVEAEIASASELLGKIVSEDLLVAELETAAMSGTRQELESLLAKVESRPANQPSCLDPASPSGGGVGPNRATIAAVEKAKEALSAVLEAHEATAALGAATAARDLAKLEAALKRASDLQTAAVQQHHQQQQQGGGDEESGSSSSAAALPLSPRAAAALASQVNPSKVAGQEAVALAEDVLAQVKAEEGALGALSHATATRTVEALEGAIELGRGELQSGQQQQQQQDGSSSNPRLEAAVGAAETLVIQLHQEGNALEGVRQAMVKRDKDELQASLDAAVEVFGSGGNAAAGLKAFDRSPVTAEAQALLHKLTLEKEMVMAVAMAIGKQDRALLSAALDRATNEGAKHPTLTQAAQLRDALDHKFGLLSAAVGARDGAKLFKALKGLKKSQLVPFDKGAVKAAGALLKELEGEANVVADLVEAFEKGDKRLLEEALASAGVTAAAVTNADEGSSDSSNSSQAPPPPPASLIAFLQDHPALAKAQAMQKHISALEAALMTNTTASLQAATSGAEAGGCGRGPAYEQCAELLGYKSALAGSLQRFTASGDFLGLRQALASAETEALLKQKKASASAAAAAAAAATEGKVEGEEGKDEPPKILDLTALFDLLDADGNGTLTKEEVVAGASVLQVTEEKAAALFDDLDKDQSGTLSRLEALDSVEGVAEARSLLKLASECSERLATAVVSRDALKLRQALQQTEEQVPGYKEPLKVVAEAAAALAEAVANARPPPPPSSLPSSPSSPSSPTSPGGVSGGGSDERVASLEEAVAEARALPSGKWRCGLTPGESLKVGERLVSRNGRFSCVLQGDGNLVVADRNGALPLFQSSSSLLSSSSPSSSSSSSSSTTAATPATATAE
jgi:hypothetical protein